MGVNYREISKPAVSKTSKGEDLIFGIQACVEEVNPARKMCLEMTKWQPKLDPASSTVVFDDSLKKTPVFPICENLARKSAPKTPLNNNDAKDTLKEMLGTETFSNESASTESKVSIVGSNNVTSPPVSIKFSSKRDKALT